MSARGNLSLRVEMQSRQKVGGKVLKWVEADDSDRAISAARRRMGRIPKINKAKGESKFKKMGLGTDRQARIDR